MSSRQEEFDYESLQDGQSIGRYLRALAEGFEKGQLRFRTGERETIVAPAGLLEMELKIGRKGQRVKLGLKVEWKEEEGRSGKDALIIDEIAPTNCIPPTRKNAE